VPEGRANPRQLWLHPGSAAALAELRENALAAGREVNGADYTPYTVLQLTQSGRYSRPMDRPEPILAHHDGVLDRAQLLPDDYPLISDSDLDRLQDRYVEAARLACRCGYDAVDIKSCHRYLLSELLAAHTRPGRYGGSFENRTRMLLETVRRVRAEVPEIEVAVRLNVYDGHPFPWGWGVSYDDPAHPDLSEPLRLVSLLREAGVALINVTAGNPYYTPHINRPFDQNVDGGYTPDEHPLAGVARLLGLAREIKLAHPSGGVLGSGYSWRRQFIGPVAAGVLSAGWADMVGLGREAFAHPDFARELLHGELSPRGLCVACSRCTQIMRDHGPAGCVPFDREIYGPIYAQGRGRLSRGIGGPEGAGYLTAPSGLPRHPIF
jgi:2,4-dienoyl-CoA reductase-like NADH-dependent reductase (Old Yellow Enzyme family)